MLHLYDSPLHRDWAFWMTVGWGVLAAVSISSSSNHQGIPVWLDTLLATISFMALFGVLPTRIRLAVRRRREQKADMASKSPEASHKATLIPGSPTATPANSFLPPDAPLRPIPSAKSPASPGNERALHQQTRPSFASPAPASTHDSPQPPTPGDVSLLKDDPTLASTTVLTHAERSLPHPVARATRAFQLAHSSRDRYEALLDASEVLAIVVSTTTAALLRGSHTDDRDLRNQSRTLLLALQRSYFTYAGATFGTWTNWLRSAHPLAAMQPELAPGLPAALGGEPGRPGIVTHLNALREERNRSAHGGKPRSQQEAALRVTQLLPSFEAALTCSSFLEELPWLLITSCNYQPRTQEFSVVAGHAMGDHPDFEHRTYRWSTPVAEEMFYTLAPHGPAPIFPYVANLFCPQCEQSELCYMYKAERNGGPAYLKSFNRGHEISDEELGVEIRSLFYSD